MTENFLEIFGLTKEMKMSKQRRPTSVGVHQRCLTEIISTQEIMDLTEVYF